MEKEKVYSAVSITAIGNSCQHILEWSKAECDRRLLCLNKNRRGLGSQLDLFPDCSLFSPYLHELRESSAIFLFYENY
jgi:hypothetical protein